MTRKFVKRSIFFAILGVTLRLNVVRCVSMAILAFLRCSVTVLQRELCIHHYSVFRGISTGGRSPHSQITPSPLYKIQNISCPIILPYLVLARFALLHAWWVYNHSNVSCDSRKLILQAYCVAIKNHILGEEGKGMKEIGGVMVEEEGDELWIVPPPNLNCVHARGWI